MRGRRIKDTVDSEGQRKQECRRRQNKGKSKAEEGYRREEKKGMILEEKIHKGRKNTTSHLPKKLY